MKPSWVSKTDPEKHPVRFLASIWQQQMKGKFGISVSLSGKERGKEMGRLRDLRLHLGDNVHFWHERKVLLKPTFPWELVQLGNLSLIHIYGLFRSTCDTRPA